MLQNLFSRLSNQVNIFVIMQQCTSNIYMEMRTYRLNAYRQTIETLSLMYVYIKDTVNKLLLKPKYIQMESL